MWIVSDLKENARLPIFYKQFTADKKVKKCVVNVSALGIFSLKLNGFEVEEYFMPGWTNYNEYVHLCPYELTEYIQDENLLEITLAEGWYSGKLGYTRKCNVYGEGAALYAEILLIYEDGTSQRIVTDESWRVGESNIVSASLLDGECVDFRKVETPFSQRAYARKLEREQAFAPYDYEPVKEFARLTPTVIFEDENVLRLDFGQNFGGFLSFTATGERDTEIAVRHAEVLSDDGTLYVENLRMAKATDTLILSGGEDCFQPRFTFHGFRYAEIEKKGGVKLSNVQGVALSQELAYLGKFECSNAIVNKIYENVLWGQRGNFVSIPTDCPQRDERLGWTGDAQVFCNSAMFNADCNRFFANYLRLICTDILPDGKIPSLVPFFIPVTDSTAGVPGWADAICVLPYYHYLHYRDEKILAQNLPYAVRHLEYYLAHSEAYRLRVKNPFGDWLSVERADDIDGISQCFLGLSARLISKMYGILKDEENAAKYDKIYRLAREAFRADYLRADGSIQGDSQTIYALSLAVEYVSADEIKQAFLKSVARANYRLTTGFIGVKYLLPALCEIGESDLAYKIIKETEYPSWGYTILNGATTIWERWNGYTKERGFETPSMNSFNHYSLGSCVEWLYSHVLGIKLYEDKPICISPSFSKELSFAKGEYGAVDGKIRVSWQYEKGQYFLDVEADDGVAFAYDFKDREILSLKKDVNRLHAVLK